MKKLVTSGLWSALYASQILMVGIMSLGASKLEAQGCNPDSIPPVPVCHQAITVPVDNFGIAIIPAFVFNAASYDNCGSVYFKARRMSLPEGYSCANPGNPDNLFDDFIQFCCEDIPNNNIMVVFRVYDIPPVAGPVAEDYLEGHFNDCMVQVEVQDKLPPSLICPTDLTISCQFPYSEDNLDVFGKIALSEAERELICIDDPGVPGDPGLQCIGLDGLTLDNCIADVVEEEPIIEVNNCGIGYIIRTFTATDDGGAQSTCQQYISIINYDPFTEEDIVWPWDLTTFDICEVDSLDPEALSPPYNQPLITDGPCDLVGVNYEDDVFDFSNEDEACFKILRTWTVIDWCQLNTPSYGIWTHIQVIKVMNNEGPVIEPIEDINQCSYDPECGGLDLDFEASAEDDCSGPNSLTWRYFIDLDNDHSFDFTSALILGETIGFSAHMPIGTHRILYTVWDGCGNISTAEQEVVIESCKAPSAKCIHGLSTNLMAMDTDGDGTPDWGMVVLQAEMFDAGSDHPCGNPVTVAFSADPHDVTRIFDCEDLGDQEIELWAIDQNGLTDYCITTVEIQDNNHICPPEEGVTGIIAGKIIVPGSGSLTGAMVYLDGSNSPGIATNPDGYFVFPSMPLGGEYVVRPIREGDVKNGVSTLDLIKIQKHLLGLETFSTPYQYIAADANNSAGISAIDIIQLRKLILGIYHELPSNKSWRFIDKAHVFQDPNNPWITPWAETYSIIPLSGSMNDVDFDAVKIGDLNLSASLQAGTGIILPRGSQDCIVEYEINPQMEGDLYRVDIYMTEARKFQALQFSFAWDHHDYQLMDWGPGEHFSTDEIRMPEQPAENGSIAVFNVNGWAEERISLMTLWVKQISSSARSFQLFMQPSPTSPVAYKIEGEDAAGVKLQSKPVSGTALYNRPNPFRDMTTVHMESIREENAVLRVFDLNGRRVFTRNLNLVKGENEFIIQTIDLREPGIYMYEIESDFQYSANRMIIVN